MASQPRGEAASYYNDTSGAYGNQQQHQLENNPWRQQGPPQYEQQYQQQQQYGAPPPVPQHPYGDQQPFAPQGSGKGQSFEEAFKIEKPKWNDLWAGILFLAVFAGFIAVSGIAIRGYAAHKSFNGGGIYGSKNDFGLTTNTLVLFVFCLVVALLLSYAYMWCARAFTKQFIWITGILNVIMGFVTAFYMLSRKYYSGGIVFLIFAVFTLICFISWRRRIPFSVLMLQTSIDVSKKYGHVYLVSFIGGLVATAFAAWFSVTLVAVYARYEPSANNPACRDGGCGSGKVIGLIAFITFAAYWFSEWLKNTIHVTISGVYGSWYFCSRDMPKGATRGAFRRAVTYSFGSISLGSLIVAIINFLRQLCSIAQQNEAQSGDICGSILWCVLGCIVSLLQWAVEFLNRYAFSHIALYGKAYIPAAKDTWRMIKDRGIDALVNECLVGPVLSMGATFVAFTCALLAYLYLVFTSPAYNDQGAYTPVVIAFAFLIGLQICNVFTTPLTSGIDTIFVACAWDPEVLMRDHPDLYARMVAVYPEVQQAIHA